MKFLGATFNPTMSWETHCQDLAKKLNKNIFLIRSLSQFVSAQALKSCYYACIHSHLLYALMAWGHAPASKKIFKLQRKAVRIVAGLGYRECCKEAFKKLEIMTLPSLYILQCIKYIHAHTEKYSKNTQRHNPTRENKFLTEALVKFKKCENSNYWGIKLYNLLDQTTRNMPRKKVSKCHEG